MDAERIEEIFEEESDYNPTKGDDAFIGLAIIQKCLNDPDADVICGADHDIIYSVDVDDVAEKMTEEDAIKLRDLNWFLYDNQYFAHYV